LTRGIISWFELYLQIDSAQTSNDSGYSLSYPMNIFIP
jgi:hypothetical protein